MYYIFEIKVIKMYKCIIIYPHVHVRSPSICKIRSVSARMRHNYV